MEKLQIVFKNKICSNNRINSKLDLSELLTENSNCSRSNLKSRLISEGIKEYKCECCGISNWNGKEISLQLHHINGINNDNRLENLQLLCPNCHSQTDNFGARNSNTKKSKLCDSLPIEDKKIIMETVREHGIVAARKMLSYRNSLINSVVKYNKDVIIAINSLGEESTFNTIIEAATFIHEKLGLGKSTQGVRSNISSCLSGRQKTCHGFKFKRINAGEL